MAAIDVGTVPVGLDGLAGAAPVTILNGTNPANLTGTITQIQVWSLNNLTGFKVGSFYLDSGTTYICRAIGTIGAVTGGATRTFNAPADFTAFDIESGDLIGCVCTGGYVAYKDSGGSANTYYYSGDYVTAEATVEFYTSATSQVDLYGAGAEPVGGAIIVCGNQAQRMLTIGLI